MMAQQPQDSLSGAPIPVFYLHYQWRNQDAYELPEIEGVAALIQHLTVLLPEFEPDDLFAVVRQRLSATQGTFYRIGQRATVLVHRRSYLKRFAD